jgi:homoprotocatechuate degradation regulator HpaR
MSDESSVRGTQAARGRLRAFSRSLPMALLKAREAVMRQFRPALNGYAITEQQWRVLRALTTVETIEVLELAHATFLLAPSLSRILKDLEERQLVLRRASDVDLRRGLISISPAGRALIERAGPHSEAIYAEITSRFGPEKLKALHDLLDELEAVLVEPVALPASEWPAQPLPGAAQSEKAASSAG